MIVSLFAQQGFDECLQYWVHQRITNNAL